MLFHKFFKIFQELIRSYPIIFSKASSGMSEILEKNFNKFCEIIISQYLKNFPKISAKLFIIFLKKYL